MSRPTTFCGFLLAAVVFLFGAVAESGAAVLLGLWKMEENAIGQRAVDSSGEGHRGTYGSNLNPNVYGPSGFGLATDFGGTTNVITVSDSSYVFSNLVNDFSVQAWINPDRIDTRQRIFANSQWGFGISNNVANGMGQLILTTFGVKDYRSDPGVLPAGTWSHVAAVMGGDNAVTFYVNGVAVGSDTHASPGNTGNSVSYIGGLNTGEPVYGRADEVAVFQGTLTQADIQQHMLYGVPTPKQPVFRYDYDSSEPLPTIPDDSGAGNPATAAGGTVYSENVPEGFATSLLPLGKPQGTGDRSVNTSAGGIVTDSINLLNNAKIAEAGGFTLETWAYRLTDTNSSGREKLIDMGGTLRIELEPGSDPAGGDLDKIQFNMITGNSAILPLEEWHHVAAVFDTLGNGVDGSGNLPGVARFYFDGQQIGSDSSITLTAATDGYLQTRGIGIGRHPTSGELFRGLLYDTRVVLGALSPGEFLLVPEPSSMILALLGLLCLAVRRRRR
ncbi:MAG: LamG domain-containing protein [Thermoguttaceae bacterium]|jgi:hypothetical protein|nr:LamG domain-containing protein [Thermoguttaceae bacterium]